MHAAADAGAVRTAPILVSLSSFGSTDVLRDGQARFVALCRAAGADGVEIRGELLRDGDVEIDELAQVVRAAGLACVYSSPELLWDAQGAPDWKVLDQGLARAETLGATVLKMSIGRYGAAARGSLSAVRERIQGLPVRLLIENDQTASGGTVAALVRFFADADRDGLDLGMTFDMGNWHWAGECPQEAARTFASRVRYVHCKGVQRQPARWVAVPLADSSAPWRSILRSLPGDVPRAIEYPLVGEDLTEVARKAVEALRTEQTETGL
ncbi:MAG TPA: TIM barrel protein [Burkholderiaceae bacterium]|nr:TIM barrel protein [Burkholderiaceae bacterium]